MIVDELRSEERDGLVERSARVRWSGGHGRLLFAVPPELSGPAEDGSPFLATCLLHAMRRHEELVVEAPVSPRLLQAVPRIQAIYDAWARELRPVEVSVAGEMPARPSAAGFGCFFSRGVDSMYSAAAEETDRVTHLVFLADLDPMNDETTRAEESRLAREAAALIGKEAVIARTNVRPFSDRLLDWSDLVAAGLSAAAQCLSGGLAGALIPSSSDWVALGPCGTHPMLDPLFSTETTTVVHGGLDLSRPAKVAWLTENRPELLPLLKVCFDENRPDNCGKCRKCIWTMLCLLAAGSLDRATSFPDRVDVHRVRVLRFPDLQQRLWWMQAADALGASGAAPELRQAVLFALRRSARLSWRERARARYEVARGRHPAHDPSRSRSPVLFYRNQTNAAMRALRG